MCDVYIDVANGHEQLFRFHNAILIIENSKNVNVAIGYSAMCWAQYASGYPLLRRFSARTENIITIYSHSLDLWICGSLSVP